MEPGQNIVTPEVATPSAPETIRTAEFVSNAPVSSQSQDQTNDSVMDPMATIQDVITTSDEIPLAEVKDLGNINVESVDRNWVGRVREVIKDDKDLPFKEEEDSEKLQEDYMKQRFSFDVDAPIEEK
jgi:hypothetical protein